MKLIDKDALVAEIERLIDEIYACRPFDSLSSEQQTALWYIKSIMSSVNTLEVKEVDINKEISQFIDANFEKATIGHKLSLRRVAKHFFKLGMRSTITEEDCKLIWNIGDEIPCMVEEDFFKELLKRYKAQKG